jgi:hypothetical protein
MDPLNYDEHREMGQEILKTRARFQQLASVVTSVYGPASRAAFDFHKVNEAIDRLCLEMRAQAEQDCPGLDAPSFYGRPRT